MRNSVVLKKKKLIKTSATPPFFFLGGGGLIFFVVVGFVSDHDDGGDGAGDNGYDDRDVGGDDTDDDDNDDKKRESESDVNMDNGGQALPDSNFLKLQELMKVLQSADSHQKALEQVPRDRKDDVFCLVKNRNNLEQKKEGKQSQFWDDGGSWSCGTTNKLTFIQVTDRSLNKVTMKDREYRYERRKEKKVVHIPLELVNKANFADQIVGMEELQHSCDFV